MIDCVAAWEAGYFGFLCSLVECPPEYTTLLKCLDDIEYRWSVQIDGNRAYDGVKLRWLYNDIWNGGSDRGARFNACTVLEFLIGTLKRADEEYGVSYEESKLAEWFWESMETAGLMCFSDDGGLSYGEDWNFEDVELAVGQILDRRYDRNGAGGFWMVPGCRVDLRKRDVWEQVARWVSWKYEDSTHI